MGDLHFHPFEHAACCRCPACDPAARAERRKVRRLRLLIAGIVATSFVWAVIAIFDFAN
jgi:hypothetical protein